MANITSIEEFEDLVSEAVVKPLVIEYTAEWCPSCKALKPFVNAIEAKSLNVINARSFSFSDMFIHAKGAFDGKLMSEFIILCHDDAAFSSGDVFDRIKRVDPNISKHTSMFAI